VELRRKGVADEIVREVLDEREPDDERALAVELVRRKVRSLGRFDRKTQVRRLVGMLGRKGYAPGLAYAVVTEVLGELPEPGDQDGP
jgi:regulatory protein